MSLTRTRSPNRPDPKTDLLFWSNDRSLKGYADGDPVTRYLDLTGRGNHLQIGSTTFAPTCSGSALNGKPVLAFNINNTQYLSGGTVISGVAARSIYIVAWVRTVGTLSMLDLQNPGPGQFWTVTCELGVRTGAGGRRAWTAPSGGTWAIYCLRMPEGGTASSITARLNGVALAETAVSDLTPNTGVGGFMLGGGASAGSTRFDGFIAEVRAYQTAHSDAQATLIENRMKSYWQLNF